MTDLEKYILMLVKSGADISFYSEFTDEKSEVWQAVVHSGKHGKDIVACFFPNGELKYINTVARDEIN